MTLLSPRYARHVPEHMSCGIKNWRENSKSGRAALDAIEIKAFVPAKDFDLSLQLYRDPGFKAGILSADMAYLSLEMKRRSRQFALPQSTNALLSQLTHPPIHHNLRAHDKG